MKPLHTPVKHEWLQKFFLFFFPSFSRNNNKNEAFANTEATQTNYTIVVLQTFVKKMKAKNAAARINGY